MNQEPEIPQTQRRIDMTAIKKETVLAYFNNAYNEYHIDSRENSITQSYDFIINTGIARIFIKIGRKRWDRSDNGSIVAF